MADTGDSRQSRKRARFVRWGVLGAALATITALVTAHQYVAGAGKPVGVDALCPFGGLETLFTFVSGAGFVEKTAASALVLLIGSVILALVMRRSFCGQLCPLGALQGMFGSIGGRLIKRRPHVPPAVDRFARWLKYAVLAFFVVWTWQAASLVMRPYDPWVAFTHITSAELLAEFGIGLAVLGVSLAGSLVYERFFCKYLCPTGAFLGLFSRWSVLGVKRHEDACIDCRACDKACPMNITVSEAATVKSPECISCHECVNACPVSGALAVESGAGKGIRPIVATGLVVAVLAGIIGVSTLAGAFDWTMPSLAEAASHSSEATGDPTQFDTGLIKGYMSMREVSQASGIAEAAFSERWGVPAAELGRPMKEIKDAYGFTPEDVKAWVAEELAK